MGTVTTINDRPAKLLRVSLLATACLASCSSGDSRVEAIDIVGFGILEFNTAISAKDPTSSIGARLTRSREMRIARHTDRIPLQSGLVYGVAFVVRGTPPGGAAEITVLLRTSAPCVLKATGKEVFENDTVLQVRIGELRHIGATITGNDNHCMQGPGPGAETFEFRAGGRKLAEKTFQVLRE